MELSLLVIFICLLIGVVFTLVGIRMISKHRKTINRGLKTRATVIDILEEKTSDGITYRPVLKFRDKNGLERELALGWSTGFKPKKKPPYEQTVYYLKQKDKEHLVLANNKLIPIVSYSLMVLGVVFLLLFTLIVTEQITFRI